MPPSSEAKRGLIEPGHAAISVRCQYELVGLNRASYYYTSATESALNLELMRCIDAQYLLTPFYGRQRMTAHLRRLGYAVNGKRIQRLVLDPIAHRAYYRYAQRNASPRY